MRLCEHGRCGSARAAMSATQARASIRALAALPDHDGLIMRRSTASAGTVYSLLPNFPFQYATSLAEVDP